MESNKRRRVIKPGCEWVCDDITQCFNKNRSQMRRRRDLNMIIFRSKQKPRYSICLTALHDHFISFQTDITLTGCSISDCMLQLVLTIAEISLNSTHCAKSLTIYRLIMVYWSPGTHTHTEEKRKYTCGKYSHVMRCLKLFDSSITYNFMRRVHRRVTSCMID